MARYFYAGDRGIVVSFGNGISREENAAALNFEKTILGRDIPGIVELCPSYNAVTVIYDPLVISCESLIKSLKDAENALIKDDRAKARIFDIPVCYGGEYGPDLGFVAETNNLDISEVINIHSAEPYQIYMLGFMPGFPFLGGLDSHIHAPRLSSPRARVPAGSVGIAGAQTGMYAIESPGGWRIIGRTPLKLFDPSKENPVMYEPGDMLRFVPISQSEMARQINGC